MYNPPVFEYYNFDDLPEPLAEVLSEKPRTQKRGMVWVTNVHKPKDGKWFPKLEFENSRNEKNIKMTTTQTKMVTPNLVIFDPQVIPFWHMSLNLEQHVSSNFPTIEKVEALHTWLGTGTNSTSIKRYVTFPNLNVPYIKF